MGPVVNDFTGDGRLGEGAGEEAAALSLGLQCLGQGTWNMPLGPRG